MSSQAALFLLHPILLLSYMVPSHWIAPPPPPDYHSALSTLKTASAIYARTLEWYTQTIKVTHQIHFKYTNNVKNIYIYF
jgi:hypothetical protein